MALLKGIWYVIKSLIFIVLALLCVYLIQSLGENPDKAVWVMIVLFLFIPMEFVKVLDIGGGCALFAADFTSCIVGAVIGYLIALALGNFASNNPGLFCGIYLFIIAIIRALDVKKFFDDCNKFTNTVSLISVGCIIVFGILLITKNHTPIDIFNNGFGIAVIVIGLLTWFYTIFAHAVRANEADF